MPSPQFNPAPDVLADDEKVFVDSIHWYGGTFMDAPNGYDMLATIYRKPGEPWQCHMRRRIYVDDKVFGSDDKKTGWHVDGGTAPPSITDDEMLKSMREAIKDLYKVTGGEKYDIVELQCMSDDPKMMFELGSREWCHMKILTEAQTKEYVETGKVKGVIG